jgi:hypothetical protein
LFVSIITPTEPYGEKCDRKLIKKERVKITRVCSNKKNGSTAPLALIDQQPYQCDKSTGP